MDEVSALDEYAASPAIPYLKPPDELTGHPAWYSPLRVLALFSCLIFFTYVDRGVIASNGVQGDETRGLQHDFDLDLLQLGILPAAFMVGLLLASIVFAELTKHYDPFRLIGVGNAIWVIASIGCGMSVGFWSLLACRIAMGIGEASIINLATPFIDDVAPPRSKALWFSIYFTFYTSGSSVGYFFGGVVGLWNWRYPFLVQALAATPLTAFLLFAPPLRMQTMHSSGSRPEAAPLLLGEEREQDATLSQKPSLLADLHCLLWQHPVYVVNSLAWCPLQATFGSYGYWGPKAVHIMLGTPEETVDVAFSLTGIVTGIVATLLGGAFLDAAGSSIRSAVLFCAVCSGISAVSSVLAFHSGRTLPLFVVYYTIAQLACNATNSPATVAQVWGVPSRLRPMAAGIATLAAHLFGDVPAPPLVGLFQGWVKDWRLTMAILGFVPLGALILFAACALVPHVDYRPHDEITLCRSSSWMGRRKESLERMRLEAQAAAA